MQNRTVLYVSGFSSSLRARDLAYEFERYGKLIRCDIPALKSAASQPFAFIEFRNEKDSEDAYYDMHGRSIDGRRITVQWAKRPPSAAWRHDGGDRPAPRRDDRDSRDSRDHDRRRSPPRRRSPSPARRDDRERSRHDDRRRSLSPRRDDRERDNRDDRDRRDRDGSSAGVKREGNGDAVEREREREPERERDEAGEDDRERRDD